MKILLLCDNYVVKEFITLASHSVGAKLTTISDTTSKLHDSYDFLFVDDKGNMIDVAMEILDKRDIAKSIVLYSKESTRHGNFDEAIHKPFLPSDIESLIGLHKPKTQILNLTDIDEIKSLLEDGDSVPNIEKQDDTVVTDEDGLELIYKILQMKPKKIRQILSGAEITIKFPKDTHIEELS